MPEGAVCRGNLRAKRAVKEIMNKKEAKENETDVPHALLGYVQFLPSDVVICAEKSRQEYGHKNGTGIVNKAAMQRDIERGAAMIHTGTVQHRTHCSRETDANMLCGKWSVLLNVFVLLLSPAEFFIEAAVAAIDSTTAPTGLLTTLITTLSRNNPSYQVWANSAIDCSPGPRSQSFFKQHNEHGWDSASPAERR